MKYLILIFPLTLYSFKCSEKNCLLDFSNEKIKIKNKNIFNKELKICSKDPLSGYYRTGKCESDSSDRGNHSVCAVLTKDFLEFTKSRGNDLSTPNIRYSFPGLNPGDRWCLCANRWEEAKKFGITLEVDLEATALRT